jgi:hypothetical protein
VSAGFGNGATSCLWCGIPICGNGYCSAKCFEADGGYDEPVEHGGYEAFDTDSEENETDEPGPGDLDRDYDREDEFDPHPTDWRDD